MQMHQNNTPLKVLREPLCEPARLPEPYRRCIKMLEHVRKLLSETLNQRRDAIKRDATYKCEVCGSCFYYPAKLREHMNIHEGINPFKCNVPGCDQSFPTKDRLRTHNLKHLSKFACDLCGKRFQTEGIKKKHMLTHSSLRPHPCTVPGCGKSFKTQLALEGHVRTHTGDKPHVCSVEGCGKAYSEPSQLSRHRLKTHGIRMRAEHTKRQRVTGEFEGIARMVDGSQIRGDNIVCAPVIDGEGAMMGAQVGGGGGGVGGGGGGGGGGGNGGDFGVGTRVGTADSGAVFGMGIGVGNIPYH